MNKLYCKYCGTKLIRLPTVPTEYDEETGEVVEVLQCINNSCSVGKKNNCLRTGGCIYGAFSFICKKCGESHPSTR